MHPRPEIRVFDRARRQAPAPMLPCPNYRPRAPRQTASRVAETRDRQTDAAEEGEPAVRAPGTPISLAETDDRHMSQEKRAYQDEGSGGSQRKIKFAKARNRRRHVKNVSYENLKLERAVKAERYP